jgi:hypothetical protein
MIDITFRDRTDLHRIDMQDIMHDGVEAVCAHLVDHLGNYTLYAPPSVPTYTRTGDLGRHWTFEISTSTNAVTGVLGNAVRSRRGNRAYGPYVMGPEDQAEQHRGRWPTTDDIADQQEPTARRLFEAVVSRRIT